MGYSVGIERKISPTASLRGVFRNDQTASVLYCNNFSESNICAKVAANFNFNADPSQRASLQWKIIFGSGKKSCCK